MINKKKEGGFYASKVRLFLNEYDGIPLEEFCKAEKVSYNKMLNCLGRTNHQYHPVNKPKITKPVKEVTAGNPLLPTLELKELVVDMPGAPEKSDEDLLRVAQISNPNTSRGPVSFTCSRVSSGRKKTSILMSMKTRKSMVKSCKNQYDFVSII